MQQIETDVLVIGAGSGGLSVAAGAVQMGARVVLLEAAEMGGDCLNHGCVPSKALIASAKLAQARRKGGDMGVAPVEPQVDYAAVMDHVAGVIAGIAPHDSQDRFEGLGCTVIRAYGRFTGPQEVEAGDTRIKARRIVIATGSRPFVPPIDGLGQDGQGGVPFLTNETLFANREKPDHLLIIGGGPIGMEMAQAHRRLGCAVTVIEGAKAMGRDDPEAAAVVLNALRSEGVTIAEDAKVSSVAGAAGDITVNTEDGRSFHGTHLLVAVGRVPSINGLDLEKAGIEYDKKGIKVDASLRSSNRKVYAIGDAAGGLQFTHVAGYHAGVVIRSVVLGLPAKATDAHIPRATYTDPELAQVGLTESEAREQYGNRLEIARFDMGENDRARAMRITNGFAKAMVVKGKPVGVTLVGEGAGELAALWSMAIANGTKMSGISSMVAPYPTLSEINKRVAGAYFTPRLFENDFLKQVVRFVQRWLP